MGCACSSSEDAAGAEHEPHQQQRSAKQKRKDYKQSSRTFLWDIADGELNPAFAVAQQNTPGAGGSGKKKLVLSKLDGLSFGTNHVHIINPSGVTVIPPIKNLPNYVTSITFQEEEFSGCIVEIGHCFLANCKGLIGPLALPKLPNVTKVGNQFCAGLAQVTVINLDYMFGASTSSAPPSQRQSIVQLGTRDRQEKKEQSGTVVSIGGHFLAGCKSLKAVSLKPFSRVTKIGEWFLGNCKNLTKVDLSPFSRNNVEIGSYFLSGCSELPSIDLSPLSQCRVFGSYFMAFCVKIRKVPLAPGFRNARKIGDGIFCDCDSLRSVDLTPLQRLECPLNVAHFAQLKSLKAIRIAKEDLNSGAHHLKHQPQLLPPSATTGGLSSVAGLSAQGSATSVINSLPQTPVQEELPPLPPPRTHHRTLSGQSSASSSSVRTAPSSNYLVGLEAIPRDRVEVQERFLLWADDNVSGRGSKAPSGVGTNKSSRASSVGSVGDGSGSTGRRTPTIRRKKKLQDTTAEEKSPSTGGPPTKTNMIVTPLGHDEGSEQKKETTAQERRVLSVETEEQEQHNNTTCSTNGCSSGEETVEKTISMEHGNSQEQQASTADPAIFVWDIAHGPLDCNNGGGGTVSGAESSTSSNPLAGPVVITPLTTTTSKTATAPSTASINIVPTEARTLRLVCNVKDPQQAATFTLLPSVQSLPLHITTVEFSSNDGKAFSHITTIGSNFLRDSPGVRTIDFSPLSNVTKIERNFLRNCYGLQRLDLSPFARVQEIGSLFLCDCMGLVKIDLSPLISVDFLSLKHFNELPKLSELILLKNVRGGTQQLSTAAVPSRSNSPTAPKRPDDKAEAPPSGSSCSVTGSLKLPLHDAEIAAGDGVADVEYLDLDALDPAAAAGTPRGRSKVKIHYVEIDVAASRRTLRHENGNGNIVTTSSGVVSGLKSAPSMDDSAVLTQDGSVKSMEEMEKELMEEYERKQQQGAASASLGEGPINGHTDRREFTAVV